MCNILLRIDEVENIMLQNKSLIELMHGYCINTSSCIDEMDNFIPIFDIMLNNQKKLINFFDEINNKILKTSYPDIFK